MGAVLLRQRRPLEARGCAGDPAPLPRECQATEPWRLRGGGPPTQGSRKGKPSPRTPAENKQSRFCKIEIMQATQ